MIEGKQYRAKQYRIAIALSTVTLLLLVVGAMLFFSEYVGWAQAAWVVASGTSGGAIALFLERFM